MHKRDWKKRHYQYDGSIPKIQRFAATRLPCGKVRETCHICKGVGRDAVLLNKRGNPASCITCQGLGYRILPCPCIACKAAAIAIKRAIPIAEWITRQTPEPVKGFMRPKGLPEHVLIRRRLQYSLPKW